MNNVPQKLRRKWSTEEALGQKRICLRADEGNCQGRLTKEHAIIYAGKQVQDEWAILDICEFHHGVNNFQDGGNLRKEKHIWIALNRAPEERLRELSKAEDKIALRDRLNLKYGVYVEKKDTNQEVEPTKDIKHHSVPNPNMYRNQQYRDTEKPLIDRIAIRAKDNFDQWGSFTLGELIKMGKSGEAFTWLICQLSGLQEGDRIDRENCEALAKLLPRDSYELKK